MPTGSDLPCLRRTGPAPRPGIVHLGPGAFFRSFVAPYTHEAMEARGGDWGIIAVSLNSRTARDQLVPQGCVYTSVTLGPNGPERRVIESIVDVLVLPDAPEAVLDALADPAIHIISLTITEKGYGHDPATGRLDPARADIAHDLRHPDRPKTAPGLIVAAMARRHAAGAPPATVLSCDNLGNNGPLIRSVVLDMARTADPALAEWIAREAAFPATMVDRITPAMTGAERHALAEAAGHYDAAIVHHEPFREWVIEDAFTADARPAWDAGGARIVADVGPYEAMKLRCLNGAHSALAYLAPLAGHQTIAEAASDPVFDAYLSRLWTEEVIPTLSPPAGVDLRAYCTALLDRFRNPAIRHRLVQIAADGSQKLPQRLLPPLVERLDRGQPAPCLALAVAGWMHHLSSADLSDPMADRLRAAAGDPAAILSLADVFGNNLPSSVQDALRTAFARIEAHGAAALVQAE